MTSVPCRCGCATATAPSRPYRVLQLASTSDMGGTERMILFLVEAIDHERFTPYVASLIGSGQLVERAAPHCAITRNFRFPFWFDPVGALRLAAFIRDNKIDLVQAYGLRADTVGRIAARLGGARVVFSSIRSIDPWRHWYHSMLDRLTAPLVNLFVANSRAGADATIQREGFAPERFEVVYSGIPERDIPRERRDEIRQSLNVAPDAFPVVGVLANLREMKGHRDIVAALPSILQAWPQCVFLFAGRDDSHGEIEQMARQQGVADQIRFLGYVPDTRPLLAAMDIFMLPSHWEGLPASVIEAMHAGLPIVTTTVGGIPELVGNDAEAVLIPPGEPDAIAEALGRIAGDDALRAKIAAGARARAQKDFSIGAMTRRMEQLYLQHLGVRPPRSAAD